MRCYKYFPRFLATGLSTLILLLFFWSSAKAELILTAPPRESVEMGAKNYGPLAAHLTSVLGETVTYKHPGTWPDYQRDMQADKFDIVFDGPHFMSWRIKQKGHTSLVRLPGTLSFVMIVNNSDEEIRELRDLAKNKICAISPPNLSTLTMMAQFSDTEQFELIAVKGGMRGVHKAFLKGKCRAAILRDKFYQTKLTVKNKADTRVVFTSKPIANQGITVSKRLDKKMREKIKISLQKKNSGTFPIFRRFSPGDDVMIPAVSDHYNEYYKLLQGVVIGW